MSDQDLAAAAQLLVNGQLHDSLLPPPNLIDLKERAVKPLYEAAKLTENQEEDGAWKRPNASKVATLTGYTGSRKKQVSVTCPSQHIARRFTTTHGGYTCDICKKQLQKNVTLYGCRLCNWDACVVCQAKLLRILIEEAEIEDQERAAAAAAAEAAVRSAALPSSTFKAVTIGLDLFRKDDQACEMLISIARSLGLQEINRKVALRTPVALAMNEHPNNPKILLRGFSALHELTSSASDVSVEECEALVQLIGLAVETFSDAPENLDLLSKLFGFTIVLYDANITARQLIIDLHLFNVIRKAVENPNASHQLAERGCALLARVLTKTEKEYGLTLMKSLMQKYASDDSICEHIFGAAIAFVGSNDTNRLVLTMELLSHTRNA